MKDKMPAEPIFVEATDYLTLKLDHDFDRWSSGSIRAGFDPTFISQGGKELGTVTHCMGGGVAVVIGQRQWYVSPKELWRIVAAADAKYQEAKK